MFSSREVGGAGERMVSGVFVGLGDNGGVSDK